jgi:hypothetical protein
MLTLWNESWEHPARGRSKGETPPHETVRVPVELARALFSV